MSVEMADWKRLWRKGEDDPPLGSDEDAVKTGWTPATPTPDEDPRPGADAELATVDEVAEQWDSVLGEPAEQGTSHGEVSADVGATAERAEQETAVPAKGTDTVPDAEQESPSADQAPAHEPFETDDGLVRFGPPTILKPAPERSAEQPGDVLEHPPDIAIDWLDIDGCAVRAVSARGHMHRHLGEVRQDSFALQAFNDYIVIAVADGVGTASASHLGSAIVARNAVRDPAILSRLRTADASKSTERLGALAGLLAYEAHRRHLEPAEIATNLIVAAIPLKPDDEGIFKVALLKVGDPSAWRNADDSWSECDPAADPRERHGQQRVKDPEGLASTKTDALPTHTEAMVWCETFQPGETLALTSDGVGNLLEGNADLARELSALWRNYAPAPATLLKFVDATVKSYDDDRTFVGHRFS